MQCDVARTSTHQQVSGLRACVDLGLDLDHQAHELIGSCLVLSSLEDNNVEGTTDARGKSGSISAKECVEVGSVDLTSGELSRCAEISCRPAHVQNISDSRIPHFELSQARACKQLQREERRQGNAW